jgi:hypothetical protein
MTRSKLKFMTAVVGTAVMGVMVALACDFETPKDALSPCDTATTCAMTTPTVQGNGWACADATEVAKIKKACRAQYEEEAALGGTNCGEETIKCKRSIKCSPQGPAQAPTGCSEQANTQGAWAGNALTKVPQSCETGG